MAILMALELLDRHSDVVENVADSGEGVFAELLQKAKDKIQHITRA